MVEVVDFFRAMPVDLVRAILLSLTWLGGRGCVCERESVWKRVCASSVCVCKRERVREREGERETDRVCVRVCVREIVEALPADVVRAACSPGPGRGRQFIRERARERESESEGDGKRG